MNLSIPDAEDKLKKLSENEGFDTVIAMLEEATFDSVSPGICTKPGCGYSTEVEPDQDRGWCESCNEGTVASALVLAGMI
jgi:hypothetical protein